MQYESVGHELLSNCVFIRKDGLPKGIPQQIDFDLKDLEQNIFDEECRPRIVVKLRIYKKRWTIKENSPTNRFRP